MNLRELAKKLGVSATTVSAALNNNPRHLPFSEETLANIRKYAAEVGYIPNKLPQKIFHPEKNDTLGLLYIQDTAQDRTLPLLQDLLQRLNGCALEYQLYSCQDPMENPRALVKAIHDMYGMNIRQIVIIGMVSWNYLDNLGTPPGLQIYVIDALQDDVPVLPEMFRCVCTTNRRQFQVDLARKIIAAGYGPILTNTRIPVLKEFGLVPPELILPYYDVCDYYEYGYAQANIAYQLIREGKCRTIMFHNDREAIGIMAGLQKMGVRIPEDVQVIGYNNAEICKYLYTPLTSIAHPANKALNRIMDHFLCGTELPAILFHPLELVQRESSFPLP